MSVPSLSFGAETTPSLSSPRDAANKQSVATITVDKGTAHERRVDVRSFAVTRQVLVRPGRTWDEDRIYIRDKTKSGRARADNIDDETAAALRRWKARQAEERLAFGPAYNTEGWIVAEADGSLVQPDTLSARWKRLERLAGSARSVYTARCIRTPRWRSRRVLGST